jgi:hypothetical protein
MTTVHLSYTHQHLVFGTLLGALVEALDAALAHAARAAVSDVSTATHLQPRRLVHVHAVVVVDVDRAGVSVLR